MNEKKRCGLCKHFENHGFLGSYCPEYKTFVGKYDSPNFCTTFKPMNEKEERESKGRQE